MKYFTHPILRYSKCLQICVHQYCPEHWQHTDAMDTANRFLLLLLHYFVRLYCLFLIYSILLCRTIASEWKADISFLHSPPVVVGVVHMKWAKKREKNWVMQFEIEWKESAHAASRRERDYGEECATRTWEEKWISNLLSSCIGSLRKLGWKKKQRKVNKQQNWDQQLNKEWETKDGEGDWEGMFESREGAESSAKRRKEKGRENKAVEAKRRRGKNQEADKRENRKAKKWRER